MRLILFLLFFTVSACRPASPDPLPALRSALTQTGELVTVEYTLSKIVKASDDKTWYKIGDRKILMSCEARIRAGIDLQGVDSTRLLLDDSVLTLILPRARIHSLSLPPEGIHLHREKVDLLRSPFSAAEREDLLRQAEEQVRQLIDSLGILHTAEANARTFLTAFLQSPRYKRLDIRFEN